MESRTSVSLVYGGAGLCDGGQAGRLACFGKEKIMSEGFDFKSLVALCRETHEVMRLRAARSINIELVVRNWLFGWYIVEYGDVKVVPSTIPYR